jgi:putative transposase
MTATLDDVINKRPVPTAEAEAARGVLRLAQEHGLSLTGPDGLLKQLTETVIETALSEEDTEHLGCDHRRCPAPGHPRASTPADLVDA